MLDEYELADTVAAKKTTKQVQPQKYVPPGMRNSSVSMSSGGGGGRRGKKATPNLNSQDDFPTLGGKRSETKKQEK